MQQLMGFLVTIFLFAGVFISSAVSLGARQEYRILKQNLNLIGREVINHAERDSERGFLIDEAAFYRKIKELNNQGELLGCIFSYKNKMNVIKSNGEDFTMWHVETENMNERNKVNTINNMVSSFLYDDSKRLEINIASEDTNDYLTEAFYNKLGENTVFIVCYYNKQIFVSGFILE